MSSILTGGFLRSYAGPPSNFSHCPEPPLVWRLEGEEAARGGAYNHRMSSPPTGFSLPTRQGCRSPVLQTDHRQTLHALPLLSHRFFTASMQGASEKTPTRGGEELRREATSTGRVGIDTNRSVSAAIRIAHERDSLGGWAGRNKQTNKQKA